MKLAHALSGLLLVLFANSTLAANKIYELEETTTYATPTYPNLNLMGTEKN